MTGMVSVYYPGSHTYHLELHWREDEDSPIDQRDAENRALRFLESWHKIEDAISARILEA